MMESYENILKLDELTEKYQKEAASDDNWVTHIKAHGLANRCLAREFTEERQRRVFDIEEAWYKGRHPLIYEEHQQLTNQHLQLLLKYRNETESDFNSIETKYLNLDSYDSVDQLSLFIDTVFKLSQNCSEKFILTCKTIIQSSVDILSKSGLKVPCSFAVIALGSVARGTATPYSDLEYAFVVESDGHSDYFTKLAVDSYFRIANMKESPLKCFDIAEIDKTYSDNATFGFHIDGITEKAGNIPTGRGDGAKKLILTIEQLTDMYRKALVSPAGAIADIGDILSSHVLVYAHGDREGLYKTVKNKCHKILAEETSSIKLIKKRVAILEQDMKTYNFLPSFESFGPPDNTKLKVKFDLFRYPTLLVDHLRLLLGLSETNPLAVNDKLKELKFINGKQCFRLNLVSALAIYIRTAACLKLQSQRDEFSLYPGRRPNKKVYNLPREIFAFMTYTVVPMKLCIFKNIESFPTITDKSGVMNCLLKNVGLLQPSFMLKAEIEYFCGDYEQAIKTIHAKCGENVFAQKPNVYAGIVEKTVSESLQSDPTFRLMTERYNLGELKPSKQHVELAAYLLYSTHKHQLALQYFISLSEDSGETQINVLKWKILAADCANRLHNYTDVFSLLGSVYSALKTKFDIRRGQTLYRFVKAMSTSSAVSGKDQQWFEIAAQAFRVLSQACSNTKSYIQAEEMANAAVLLFDKLHTGDGKKKLDSHYIELIVSLALIHSEKGEHKKGIQYLNHYLHQLEELHTDCVDHPDIALVLNGLGKIHETTGDHEMPMHFYNRAVSMTENLHTTTSHVSVAQCYRNVAALETKMLDYQTALDHYQIARRIYDRRDVGKHERAGLLVEMGLLHSLMEDDDSALSTLRSALNMLESTGETTHIDIAEVHSAYGTVYSKTKEENLSLKHHTISLEMTKKVIDEINDIPILVQLHGEMGKLSVELGIKAKILNIKKASRAVESVHPDIASSYLKVGQVYMDMCLYDQSLVYIKRSCDMYRAVYGETNCMDLARATNVLGSVYENMGEYSKALEYHTKSLDMRLAVYGAEATHAHIATSYSNIGLVYDKMGEYSKALEYYTRSLNKMLAVYGAEATHADIAASYNNIGNVYNKMGEYSKAVEYYTKSLDMMLAIHGAEATHADIASSYSNIGLVYDNMGEHSKALKYYTKSLDMRLAMYGAEATHAHIAASYNNIGLVYHNMGEYSKALEYYTKSLDMMLAVHGSEATHADIAASYNNIGSVYGKMGEYNKALNYYTKSLEMKLAVYGAEATHADIAASYSNIGSVYCNMGEYSKALEYHTKSLDMGLAVYGAEATHADIADSYNNIGNVYDKMGEYSKALEYYTKSLDMQLAVYGTEATHAHIASSYNNIGLVYYNMGENSKALEYYTKSLDMRLAVYGAEATHADIAVSYNNIGSVYDNMGEYSKALEYHTKSLDMELAVYGAEATHADIATSYNNIGNVHSNMGEHSKALECYTKSLDMRLAVYGAEATHADIAISYTNIGIVNGSMGEYSKALEYYTKSLDMMLAVYGAEATHAHIAASYKNIGNVCYKMGEYSKAVEYLLKATSIS